MTTTNARSYTEIGWDARLGDDILIGFIRLAKDNYILGVSKLFKQKQIPDKWTWVSQLGMILEKELQQDMDEFKQIGRFKIIEKRKSSGSSADPTLLFQSSLSVSCKVEELKSNKAGRLV